MTDTRISVATDKHINLGELDVTLGSHGLLGSPGLVMCVEGSPVTLEQLQAAVDAYDDSKERNREAETARQIDYRNEADPLFFGFQRGENTEQEWLDKVAEIRARYPYSSDG